ncbi:MAG: hypothetical protein IJK28_12930 [Clostridia bacterium]|nr:hypothetical protein [Clostridia bacterium]
MKRIWKPLLIIGCILFVVWLVVYLALCSFNFEKGSPVVMLSLIFGVLAFILTAVSLSVTGLNDIRNDEAYALMPLVLCGTSLTVSLVFNAVIMLVAKANPDVPRWLIILDIAANVVILGFAAIDMVYAIAHIGRVSIQTAQLSDMQSNPLGFSAQLGKLLGMAGSPKVKAALLSLKETVDMSSNTTTTNSSIREKAFGDALTNLESKLICGAPEDEVCELADTARRMWLARNAVRG